MKGKLTPKESFVLYGVWIIAAFGLFLLGLYWGKGQATGSQEITTQQPTVGSVPQPVSKPQVVGRLDLSSNESPPAVVENQQTPAPAPSSSSSAAGPTPGEVKPPPTSPAPGTAASAKSSAVVATSEKEIFSIQVGALDSEEEARKMIVRLKDRGYTGILDKPVSRKDPFFRVRVGNYSSRADAVRAEALLKDEGFLTFVKKVR